MTQGRYIKPTRPPVPYLGGKRQLASRIAARAAQVPHDLYAEPFVGAGGVFLRRTWAPSVEIVNDVNAELVTFLRCLQRHPEAFRAEIRYRVQARAEFERLKRQDPTTLTDLERAARFFYLQRTAFGGKIAGRTFGVDATQRGGSRFNSDGLDGVLEQVHRRLSGVVVECLDWREFLRRYDRPGALFYLDPPYHGHEGDYGSGVFRRSDFEAMAEVLNDLKGRFLMSLNDTPEVRSIFAGFAQEQVRLSYFVGGYKTGAKPIQELLIHRGCEPAGGLLDLADAPW